MDDEELIRRAYEAGCTMSLDRKADLSLLRFAFRLGAEWERDVNATLVEGFADIWSPQPKVSKSFAGVAELIRHRTEVIAEIDDE